MARPKHQRTPQYSSHSVLNERESHLGLPSHQTGTSEPPQSTTPTPERIREIQSLLDYLWPRLEAGMKYLRDR